MQVIKAFESRCVAYQEQHRIQADTAAQAVYLHCHNHVYGQVDYMLPEHPPSVEMLAIVVRDVCHGDSAYTFVFDQLEERYVNLVGDLGVSHQVIFYYVSNVIISLLVLNRANSQLSSEILIKIIQRFNFRDAVLRAGIEVMAEEVLRRCFTATMEAQSKMNTLSN